MLKSLSRMSSFERYSCGVIWSGSESMMSRRVEVFGRLSMANCLSGCMLMSFSLDILVLAECKKIYKRSFFQDHLTMSLDEIDNEKMQEVLHLLEKHPEGLGKNEVKRSLDGVVSPNTVDDKIDFLLDNGFMMVVPDDENYRRGMRRKYVLLDSIDLYLEFLNKIVTETQKYIIPLKKYVENTKEINMDFLKMIVYPVNPAYRLPHLLSVISSWNHDWLNNSRLMKEILFVWFQSFKEIYSILGPVGIMPNIDKVNQTQREERKSIEAVIDNKIADGVDLFDKMDENFLNFYRDPKQKLDTIYQDIK